MHTLLYVNLSLVQFLNISRQPIKQHIKSISISLNIHLPSSSAFWVIWRGIYPWNSFDAISSGSPLDHKCFCIYIHIYSFLVFSLSWRQKLPEKIRFQGHQKLFVEIQEGKWGKFSFEKQETSLFIQILGNIWQEGPAWRFVKRSIFAWGLFLVKFVPLHNVPVVD